MLLAKVSGALSHSFVADQLPFAHQPPTVLSKSRNFQSHQNN